MGSCSNSRSVSGAVVSWWILVLALTAVAGCGHRPDVTNARLERPPTEGFTTADSVAGRHLEDGISFYRSGSYPAAVAHLDSAAQSDPTCWTAYYFLGLCRKELGDASAAQDNLLIALNQAPSDPRTRSHIYVALGEVALDLGNLSSARLNYVTAINLWPESASAQQALERLNSGPGRNSR